MIPDNWLIKSTFFLIFISLLVTIMILGQTLLVPLTWAFLFSFVLYPCCVWLEKRKMGRATAAVLCTVLFCIISGFILSFLIYQAAIILREEGAIYENLKKGIENLITSVEQDYGIAIDPLGASSGSTSFSGVLSWVARQVNLIGKNLVTITLIPMYLFFILNYRGLVRQYMESTFKGGELESMRTFFTSAKNSIQNYLAGTLLLTGVSAIMSFVILLFCGIHYAFFFAVFIAVLNLLPYIGNLIAFAVVLVFVWITKESMGIVLLVGGLLYASNLVQENFLRPKMVGDKMEMNAMMVFSAVILGGMIWGFSGMVLFIPLLGILQALLNSKKEWKGYAIFFKSE